VGSFDSSVGGARPAPTDPAALDISRRACNPSHMSRQYRRASIVTVSTAYAPMHFVPNVILYVLVSPIIATVGRLPLRVLHTLEAVSVECSL
jgi:hypothetical protein